MAVNVRVDRKKSGESREVDAGQASSRALSKGLRLLEVLAGSGEPMTLARLADGIDLGKVSTLRLLQTLMVSGYVAQNSRGEYLLQAAWHIPASDEWARRLPVAAIPDMTRLNDTLAETVSIAILRDDHIRVIETMESPHHVRMSNWRNRILAPYASSLGKAIAAFQPPEVTTALINVYGLYGTTENTLTDLPSIREEMERVRRQGYAREYEETVRGGCCFAAPVRDPLGRVRAAISVSLPTLRLTPALEAKIPELVIASAEHVTTAVARQLAAPE